mmetsp:Transcript_820/g.2522  ORF Transcript_820/g.2522 Transcript_820/m.2522 type:complete len:291 (-) Transcript_820:1580-2452(-)
MRPRRDCSWRHGRGGAEPREWPASGISTSEVRQPSPGRGSRSAAGESGALRVGGAGGPVGPTSGSAAAALGELAASPSPGGLEARAAAPLPPPSSFADADERDPPPVRMDVSGLVRPEELECAPPSSVKSELMISSIKSGSATSSLREPPPNDSAPSSLCCADCESWLARASLTSRCISACCSVDVACCASRCCCWMCACSSCCCFWWCRCSICICSCCCRIWLVIWLVTCATCCSCSLRGDAGAAVARLAGRLALPAAESSPSELRFSSLSSSRLPLTPERDSFTPTNG